MNIVKAAKDKNLFLPYLQGQMADISSFRNWLTILKVIYGGKIRHPKALKLIEDVTHRDPTKLPREGFDEVLLLVGRRGGKSKISSLIAGYSAVLSGNERRLSPGELGQISIVSPTKLQSSIIKNYTRSALSAPMLEREIVQEDKDGFQLSTNVRIQILSGDFKSVRGFSNLMVICEEICWMHLSDDRIRSDTELIRAVRPSVATTGGKILAISTKYMRRGWAYRTWKRCYGNNNADTLVVDAPSKKLNPLLSDKVIERAMKDDMVAARSEFLNEWRDDVGMFLPESVVMAAVKSGRLELLYRDKYRYQAFCDCSGGRSDDASLAIAHKVESKGILDYIAQYKSPHSPAMVIQDMCRVLRKFKIHSIVGDSYAANFVSDLFLANGIRYTKSPLPKSALFLEFIPIISSGGMIELLDNPVLIRQLIRLERHTRSGGKDLICKPSGGKDDVANSCAGVAWLTVKRKRRVGAFFGDTTEPEYNVYGGDWTSEPSKVQILAG